MFVIGVLGSNLFIEAISEYYPLFPEVSFVDYTYESPWEIDHLIDKAGKEVDTLLFSGAIAFYFGQRKINEYNLMATYVPFNEFVVSLSLFSIYFHEKIPLEKISIDLPKQDFIENVLKEIQISNGPNFIKDYPWIFNFEEEKSSFDFSQFVQFHADLYKAKKTQFALTSIHAVYEELQKLEIPSIYMVQPKQTLKEALEKTITLTRLKKTKDSQIAVISLKVNNYPTHQDEQVFRLQMLQSLNEMARQLNARVSMDHYQPFLIYTNRGSLEAVQKERLQTILELDGKIKSSMQIGIGYGYTMNDAENHANQALYFTEKHSSEKTTVFLLDEDKKLIGPLFENEKQYTLKNEDQEIQLLAEQLKMTAKNLLRFFDFLRINQFRSFSAQELADYFAVSRRSAERIIKRFLEQKYIHITGEEQPYDQGRPRALYNITEKLSNMLNS
ncbi:MarR family transcriptional regulator [Neobacillus sp. NRS-1170]|uniref:MarR family transcriptional regulator n=1 Tax=Neobacillus sp. NRS-1170 TaxID=3233898 RepID=UPI003D2B8957